MYGYTLALLSQNKRADGKHLGVRLGRVCIKNNIPVSKVALDAKVTRQTVYNWFRGLNEPTGPSEAIVLDLIQLYAK